MAFFRKLLCVSLCISLALSSNPCYSYAYADESQEVGDGVSLVSAGGDTGSSDIDSGTVAVSSESSARSSDSDTSGVEGDSGEGKAALNASYLSYLADITSILGEIADYYRSGSVGVSPLADINSVYDKVNQINNNLGAMLGMTEGRSSASNRYTWSVNGYSWSTGKTGIAYLISWMVTQLTAINANLVHVDSNLKYLYSNSYATHTFPGASGQTTEGFAEILWRISYLLYDQSGGRSVGNTVGSLLSDIRKQWGYGYGGTKVIYDDSPASWLEWLYKYSWTTHTFVGESSITTKGVAEILWRMESKLWDTNRSRSVGNIVGDLLAVLTQVNDRDARSNAWGYDYGQKKNYYEDSPAGWLKYLKEWAVSSNGWGYDYGSGKGNYYQDSPAGWLEWLYKYSWTSHTFAGETAKTTKGFAEILWLIDSKLWDTNRGRSVGNLLGDVLAKLDDLTVNVKGDLIADVDLGYIEARLDTIADLMKIGAAMDVVDAIVGDFDSTASAALVGEVQAAASNAFPFCVPAVIKQIFGLVQSDPSPPVLDFEVGGQSLHIDCAPMQGFADVLGWACRFLFLFVLVASSRRFIYTGVAS